MTRKTPGVWFADYAGATGCSTVGNLQTRVCPENLPAHAQLQTIIIFSKTLEDFLIYCCCLSFPVFSLPAFRYISMPAVVAAALESLEMCSLIAATVPTRL